VGGAWLTVPEQGRLQYRFDGNCSLFACKILYAQDHVNQEEGDAHLKKWMVICNEDDTDG